jgi:hypothetical protein
MAALGHSFVCYASKNYTKVDAISPMHSNNPIVRKYNITAKDQSRSLVSLMELALGMRLVSACHYGSGRCLVLRVVDEGLLRSN